VAIGAFAPSQIISIKEVGVGTALTVVIDATLIRAMLVPSPMALVGRWSWWAPRPVRRLHGRRAAPATARRALESLAAVDIRALGELPTFFVSG
jgi:uncharacterized membrane protein YdfJ with MMPL/SSD domain